MAANGTYSTPLTAEERLLERLKDPKVARSLDLIIDKIDVIVLALMMADGFLRRSDEIVEAVAEGLADLNAAIPGVTIGSTSDTVEHVKDLFQVSIRLKEVLASPEFNALMSSGILSPETVSVVGKAGASLSESYRETTAAPQEPPQKIGIFGLLRMLNDPDIQRSLRLLLDFGKRFGQKINS